MVILRTTSHAAFSIHLHMVFVTKYRRKVFTKAMIEDMKQIFEKVLTANNSILETCQGEPDPREDKKSGGLYELILLIYD